MAIELTATTIYLAGNLATNANASTTGTGGIALTGAVVVRIDDLVIDTRNSSDRGDGDVTINGDVNADDAAAWSRSLTIIAAGGAGGGSDGTVDVANLGTGANGSLDGVVTIV